MRVRVVAFLCLFVTGGVLAQASPALAAPGPADPAPGFNRAATGTINTNGAPSFAVGPRGEAFVVEPDIGGCPERVFTCDTTLRVARFSRDGKRDPAFGDGARLVLRQGRYQETAIAVAPDGRPVVAAFDGESVLVARFGLNGFLDPGFGSGGIAAPLPEPRGTTPQVEVLPDGKVLLAYEADERYTLQVSSGEFVREGRLVVARFLANGILDPSFGSGGTTVVPTEQSRPDGLVPRADGGFYVGLSHCCGSEDALGVGVAAFGPAGTLDPAFGSGGLLFVSRPTPTALYAIAADGAGRLLLIADGTLIRLLPDGQLDTGFANGGTLELGRRVGFTSIPVAVTTDGQGRILGIGGAGAGTYVFRLRADGSRDRTFGAGSAVKLRGPGISTTGFGLQPDGRIVAINVFGNSGLRRYRLEALQGGTSKVKCLGERATIVGSAAAEKIDGTNGRDVIVGGAGSDRLRGLAGDDLLCGGAGRDTLLGGGGDDQVRQ